MSSLAKCLDQKKKKKIRSQSPYKCAQGVLQRNSSVWQKVMTREYKVSRFLADIFVHSDLSECCSLTGEWPAHLRKCWCYQQAVFLTTFHRLMPTASHQESRVSLYCSKKKDIPIAEHCPLYHQMNKQNEVSTVKSKVQIHVYCWDQANIFIAFISVAYRQG